MDLDTALDWARTRTHGVLITIRADGRPQSSDIAFAIIDDRFKISLTADRAKTANARRDPRVVLHLSDPSSWTYLSFDGTVQLSPVAESPDDGVVGELVDYYEHVTGGPHPDWDDYRRAMVAEGRMIATFVPTAVVGQIN